MKSKIPVFSGTIILSSMTTTNSSCTIVESIINPIKHYCTQQECGSGLQAESSVQYCTVYLTDVERKAKHFGCEAEFNKFLNCSISNQDVTCRSDFDSREQWEEQNSSGSSGYYDYYSNSDNECYEDQEALSDCISRFYNTEDTGGYYGYYDE